MSGHDITVYRPRSLNELDEIAADSAIKPTYVAGATDIMLKVYRWNSAECLVDLTSVRDLSGTTHETDSEITIGATVPVTDLIRHPLIQTHFPLLVDACRQIGSVQIQNRATLGGNIANASPAGDSLPPLSVYDAKLKLGPRKNGQFEIVKIDDIVRGPGSTDLDNRYIAFIALPKPETQGQFGYFRKVGQRYSLAISKLSLAVLGWTENGIIRDIRICAGSVSPVVRRAANTEACLRGERLTDECIARAAEILENEVTPITDIRSTSAYRSHTCGAVLKDALHGLLSRETVST